MKATDAQNKICPIMSHGRREPIYCIADKCMGWEVHDPYYACLVCGTKRQPSTSCCGRQVELSSDGHCPMVNP